MRKNLESSKSNSLFPHYLAKTCPYFNLTSHHITLPALWSCSDIYLWKAATSKTLPDSQNHQHTFQLVLCLFNHGSMCGCECHLVPPLCFLRGKGVLQLSWNTALHKQYGGTHTEFYQVPLHLVRSNGLQVTTSKFLGQFLIAFAT